MNSALHLGEAISWLRGLPAGYADAVITDPPYSSGGLMRSDRANQTTNAKYTQSGVTRVHSNFSGDNRDQRSWITWSTIWIHEALRVVKPGGYIAMFTDWRQLPATTDAIQSGGAVWRGLAVWDKGGGARAPHKGYFRHQCEYVVWGSNGALPVATHDGPFPGVYRHQVNPREKFHVTGKPVPLMRELSRIVPPGGLIVDPFAGSGSTGVGAVLEGRRFHGCELNPEYFEIARRRVAQAEQETKGAYV